MKKIGYFDECQFCKPKKPRYFGTGWYSTARASVCGVVEDTDGGDIPLEGLFYLSANENGVAALVHFFPAENDDGELTGAGGVIAVSPSFEYCPYCGRRLDDAQGD